MDDPLSDNQVLATLITVWLIREGGHIDIDEKEWRDATADDGTLWISRENAESPIQAVLMRKLSGRS